MTGYYTACSRIRQLVGIEIAERLVSVGLTVTLLYLWAGDDLARACCAITFGSSAGCILTSHCCICATGAICGGSRASTSRCESACCA